MRSLKQFSFWDWLKLAPLNQGWRQVRNDFLLAAYRRKQTPASRRFVADNLSLRGQDIAIVIAFEQPWTLEWQLEMARHNFPQIQFLVFDNSRTLLHRSEIARVCERRDVPYLALPPYRTRHVNRSHGMAMSWVYHNIVAALQPRCFGYLDHDLIPVAPVELIPKLLKQPVFGMLNDGNGAGCWNLWAGYCFFRFDYTSGKRVNFLYDFPRGLDTGGRNWPVLYRQLSRNELAFADRTFVNATLAGTPSTSRQVEFIDNAWIHIGGVGYNDNFEKKLSFFKLLREQLEAGHSFNALLSGEEPKRATAD